MFLLNGSGHQWGFPGGPGFPHYYVPHSNPDARRACRSFRRLDQCEQQIGPQETKFQLLNSAHEPIFHCNCTRR